MSLDDDVRHSERNEQARQRSADSLRPVTRKLLAEFFEVEEDELPAVRDAVKGVMRDRKRREERKNATIMETLKWVVGAAGGAALTWIAAHSQGGGK